MGCCQAEHKHTYVLALVSLPGKIPFLNSPETQTWEIKPIFFPIDVFFFFSELYNTKNWASRRHRMPS